MARILLVDDEEGLRIMMGRQLRRGGYEVTQAVDGLEAAELLATESFDVVVSDMKMPRLDGMGLLARARELAPETEFIILTGHGNLENAVEAFKTGNVFDYLLKPLNDIQELNIVVGRAVERRTLRAENERLVAELEAKNRQMTKINAVLENAVEGISFLDSEGRYRMTNTMYASILGYPSEEMLGMHWTETVYPEDMDALCAAYCQTQMGKKITLEARGVRKDGSCCYQQLVFIPSFDSAGVFCGHHRFMKDVSEQKAFEQQIEHQAFHDTLTGLPNRAMFVERLKAAYVKSKQRHRHVALLFIDLDNFKTINDSLGHDAGDQLLIAIAERLSACIRQNDTVSRLGGDEFTLLLEDMAEETDAIRVANRILESLRTPVRLSQEEVFASVSIGIAYAAPSWEDADSLLRDADTAMYHAKSSGKSSFTIFEPSMNDSLRERVEIETALHYALERGEFRVHYQPLIDLETGRLTGVEALIRWQHPERGLVPPGKFISISEETGIIVPIGYWVMEEACRQTKEWIARFPGYSAFTVNVNLSGKQLQRADIVERVKEVLQKTGLPPGNLKLEITESVMMKNIEDTTTKLTALKELGVQLAMDDFGTGYSSMAGLSNFPLDTVKIDRTFIDRMTDQQDAASIVSAIILLSRSLNLDVTGEGVETADQVTRLQALGCHIGQGFYFDRPLAADKLTEQMGAGYSPKIQFLGEADKEMIEKLLSDIP